MLFVKATFLYNYEGYFRKRCVH